MPLPLPFLTCGMMGSIDPLRPLVADADVLVTTASRALVGRVPAVVRWTEVLDGPDRLDSITLPKWFLKQNGVKVSRPDLMAYGWYARYAGHWYTIDNVVSDNETTVTFSGKSAEVSDLKRLFSSTGRSSFLRTAELPTVIMDDLLMGTGDIEVTDPSFEGSDYSSYTDNNNYIWLAEGLYGDDAESVEAYAVFENDPDSGIQVGSRISANVTHDLATAPGTSWQGAEVVLYMVYVPSATYQPLTFAEWIAVTPFDWFPVSKGASFRFSAEVWRGEYYVNIWSSSGKEYVYHPENLPDVWTEALAAGGKYQVEFWWYAGDKSTVLGRDCYPIEHPGLARQRQYWPSETEYVTAKGDYMRVVLTCYAPDGMTVVGSVAASYFCVDNVVLDGAGLTEDTGWRYHGAAMNARETDVLYTDNGWIEFGTWTVGASSIYSTVSQNQLAYIISGDVCAVHFEAGGAGALCDIFVDGVVVESGYDVSGACTYEITGLDNSVEHIVSFRVAAVKVAIEKLVLSPEMRCSVSWADMDGLECLDDLVSIVGGEIAVDTENKRLYHLAAVGSDLLAENIIDLRRGSNLLSLKVETRRDGVINHLVFLGYGSGSTRLRIVVYGQGTNDDGQTSVDIYDVQWGKYENPDCQDYFTGLAEAQALVNEWQWSAVGYRATCTDEAASHIHAGDTVRCYWDADPDDIINVSVRVLEITRDNQGGPATLIVGTRVSGLPDRLAATARKLDRVSRNL